MGSRLSVPADSVESGRELRESAGGPGMTTGTASDVVSQTGADGVTAGATEGGPMDPLLPAEPAEPPAAKDPELDPCGMPPGEWVEVIPPPRIKESRLTADEQTRFRGHLDRIFGKDALWGQRLQFDPDDVVEVCEKVIPYLESEPMLIDDVPFEMCIVADLHGQLHDLWRIFRGDAKDGKPGWECQKYLFLGDYVDRGRQSLEIVMGLFCLKMFYPDRIFLLRGNHEFAQANWRYGFCLDFHERYSHEGTAKYLYDKVNFAFCYLSVGAIVGNTYYCAHAGISVAGFSRALMKRMKKPQLYSQNDVMAHDMMWSDPAKGLHGTTFDSERATSLHYGYDEIASALHNMQCKGMFRGHTLIKEGYEVIGDMCIALFSCTGQSHNKGAVAYLDARGKLRIRVMEIDERRVKWDAMLLRMDGDVPDYNDVKTKFDQIPKPAAAPAEPGEIKTIQS